MLRKFYSSLFFLTFIISFFLSGCGNNQIKYQTDEYIKDWLVIGSFPNCEGCSKTSYHHDSRCTGFYTDYLKSIGGEKNAIPTVDMKVKIEGQDIEKAWFKHSSAEDKIFLNKFINPKDFAIAYAFCQIESHEDKKSILSIGSNDGIRVFFNGEEVHESHDYNGRWLQPDNDYIPVELKKGINNLMLKIDQGTGNFGYVARFLDYDSVVTNIRNDLDTYKRLKVVSINDTLEATFGTASKISVLNPKGKVKIELIHAKKGKMIEKVVFPGEDVPFIMEKIPDGFITMKATFPTPNDGDIISETKYYNGKIKKHPRVKRLTKDLTIVDEKGKPFFPIGTYGASPDNYKLLKEAGYNFVVAPAENLDKVHEAGLLAAVPVHSKDNNPEEYYEFISKYKDHPAVLCWMLYDEPGYHRSDLLYIYDIYKAAYKADKIHPSYLVITTSSVYKTFGPCCDVLAIDTYPVTNGQIEEVGDHIKEAYDQLERETPIWHCGQMFTWPEQRRPNPQEHRFMTYYPLMNGAKGMLWYTFKGYGQYLPVDDPELWEAQQVILKELNELAPLYLEAGFGKEIQLTQENENIRAIVKKSSIGTYLITANISKTDEYKVEIKIGKKYNGNASVYSEDRSVVVKDGIIKENFKPLDVHIYKLN
jgi:hypothetical protein